MRKSGLRWRCSRDGSPPGCRISALRNGQRFLRRPAQGGAAFHQGDERPSSPEFADYLLDIATVYPEADTIHLVLDNLSSHTRKAVIQRFGGEAGDWLWNRFAVHYTPKDGSWLNQAEIAISLFSRQCLAASGASWIREQKELRYPQAWFVESAHGDGDAQAAGEARRFVDRACRVGIGSGASVLSAFE
jgi:DDE superfamily endonuclease